MYKKIFLTLTLSTLIATSSQANSCADVPTFKEVQSALAKVQAEQNGGFGLHM